jgi:hypothetical protein
LQAHLAVQVQTAATVKAQLLLVRQRLTLVAVLAVHDLQLERARVELAAVAMLVLLEAQTQVAAVVVNRLELVRLAVAES